MYTRILVPLDGSPPAEQVLPHVEALARAFGSAVTLLRVVTPPKRFLTTAPPVAGAVAGSLADSAVLADLVADERRDAEAYLVSHSTDLAGRLGSSPTGGSARLPRVEHEHPDGDAADVIVERARATGADLVAITTHGRGGLGRLVFGSVADAVLRAAPCPILLVRTRDPGTARPS